MNAVNDVWGGEDDLELVARFFCSEGAAADVVARELNAGYRLTIEPTLDYSEARRSFDFRM